MNMIDESPDWVKAKAASDHNWEHLACRVADLERLALGRFNGSIGDRQLIQALAAMAVGDLELRKYEGPPDADE